MNDVDYVAALLGAWYAGGTASPISFTFTAKELAFQMENCGAKGIIADPSNLSVVEEAARLVGLPKSRILLFGKAGHGHQRYQHFSQLKTTSRVGLRPAINPSKDLAALVYSSGTTGLPKGVSLSHTNLLANNLQMGATEFGPPSPGFQERVLGFLPFSHIYAMICLILRPLERKVTNYVLPRFDLEMTLRTIQEQKITYMYIVPPVALALAKHPLVDKYDLSSLGGLNSAAAPLAPQLIEDVYQRLHVPSKQAYGLSETAPCVSIQSWDSCMDTKGSVGKILPNHVVVLVDTEGNEVSADQPGEIWVKGPNVFLGYYKNEQATSSSMTGDGFFRTGDIGYYDKDGNIYITDRVKELIKYRGYQVAPAELEALLLKNPKVADVAVLGLYDESIVSEVPRAFIKAASGLTPNAELGRELAEWMNGQVSYPKKLRGGVQFVDEVPKSTTGKILRRVLKDKYGSKLTQSMKSKL